MVKTEYKAGPLTINLRVLMEPKGFLRIIIMFVALLAFALTAGFNSTGDSNRVTCTSTNVGAPNYTAVFTFNYPYDTSSFSFNIRTPDNFTRNTSACASIGTSSQAFSSSAQFFVAMGILTIIYVAGAILVYMLFITPELFMAKWLVIGDLFGTLAFGALYTVASIAWSAGAANLNFYLQDLMNGFARNCFNCDNNGVTTFSPRTQPFTQAAIAAIFGWLASFIWFASVWFVYKDTMWHKDETGPLAKVYEVTREKRGGQAAKQDQGEQEEGGSE